MTPDQIKSQRFGVRLLWGLRPEEVSAFLEDVAEAYSDVQQWNVQLMAQVERLESQNRALPTREHETSATTHIETLRTATLREIEALLHDAQARAQTLIDEAKESEAAILRGAEAAKARMQIEAEAHLSRATAQAESLIMTAREEEAALRSEIDRLGQSRLQLVDDIRAALNTYQQWLASVDPRGRARGRRDMLEPANGDAESISASNEVGAG
jgi:DivIVA domain-containing protein